MNARRVTLKQISDACGLSLSTVSAALNNSDGRYNEETVRQVREVAERLGYRVNQQAKILRGAKSGLVGIIKSISLHQVVAEFAIHAGEAIHASGYRFFSSDISNAMLTGSGGLPRALEIMQDAHVEGVLIESLSYCRESDEAIQATIRAKIPVTLADGYPYDNVSYAETDYYYGFSELCLHFVRQGYRSIALAMSKEDLASVKEHFTAKGASNWRVNEAVRAVRDVASKHRVKVTLMAMPSDATSSELEGVYFAPGARFVDELVQGGKHPRAIIFINDLFAVAALRACHEAGVRVPEDLAIGACDGSAVAHYTVPRLTSIEVPVPEIARASVRLLMEIIQGKVPLSEAPRALLRPKLLVGESCGGNHGLNNANTSSNFSTNVHE